LPATEYSFESVGTPKTFMKNAKKSIHSSTPVPSLPKIQKYDFHDIYTRMKCGSQTFRNFNPLKDNARIWIGMFESMVVAAGGDLEIHGPSVLAFFLVDDAATW
jgi:hypothetical protein